VTETANRRRVKSRERGWSKRLAAGIAARNIAPDVVSAIGLSFAFLGGACLALSGVVGGGMRLVLLVAGGVSIQLRLLCNMLDGMVAVEHGKGGAFGPIWNELPDRIADALILAGAGYGAVQFNLVVGPMLGWLCAVLAVLTAYVRELGHGMGFAADFSGPLAKPQRMGVLTVVILVSLVEKPWVRSGTSLVWGLGLIALLTAVTTIRRTLHLARLLKARADEGRP
jgi:phosphatidylglycerophosphate synthase